MPENTQYQRVKEITDQLEAGIQNLFESEQYRTYLNTMSKFHDYSLNNILLIAFQKPDATLVAGYTAWQKQFGRQVQKGEKAIHILAPTPYKQTVEMEKIDPVTQKAVLDENGDPVKEEHTITRSAFKVVNVFDVSQTEGRELPMIGVNELTGDVKEYETFFEALKRTCPVPMEFENITSGAKGYYHQTDRRIALQEGMSQIQTIKTAIHEMSHQKLHALPEDGKTADMAKMTRNSKEVEAESVAYTVCQHFGIDTSDYSFAYIAGWSHGKETPELKASLQTIRQAAKEMINDIEGHVKELQKERESDKEITGMDLPRSLYSAEQWHQIESGVKDQLDVKLYSDPKLSPEQMDMIKRGLVAEAGGYLTREDVLRIADPKNTPEQMKTMMMEIRKETLMQQAAEIRKEEPAAGRKDPEVYRYYSTQRPIGPGTFPKEDQSPMNVVNFDQRTAVEDGKVQAWGYLEYAKPLTDKQMRDYELKAAGAQEMEAKAPKAQHRRKKSVLADLHAKQELVSGTKAPSAAKNHAKEELR